MLSLVDRRFPCLARAAVAVWLAVGCKIDEKLFEVRPRSRARGLPGQLYELHEHRLAGIDKLLQRDA